jgi:cytochrome c biogenesis protein CcmG/thiol:disulfide interchange protein DsbE
MRRRAVLLVAALGVAAVIVVGLTQAGGESSSSGGDGFSMSLAEQQRALAGAPAPLAALHAQGSRLLDGSLRDRLKELRGYPVVINKWGSWCPPCRLEFPVFQEVAVKRGKQIAFLGLDGKDYDGEARAFLREHPVSYPNYRDRDEKISRALGAGGLYPMTIFVDRKGKVALVHQGPFDSATSLEQAIKANLGV